MAPNAKAKRLFVLAGYRASGKTTALHLAEKRDDFPIFPPNAMEDFRKVSSLNPEFAKSAGFHTYNDFGDLSHIPQPIMGIHYDLVMPVQNMVQRLYKQRAAKSGLTLLTPKLWTSLLRETVENGSIERCINVQFAHLRKLSSSFAATEISVVTTDWETNRLDWINRMERITSSTLSKQRGYQQHSFNIALFDEDLKLAEHLYDSILTQWSKLLKESGARHLWIQRTDDHYDVRPINFSAS